jgi:hypothetical protein
MTRYVVDYEAEFEASRNRLTTFFRVFLVIPHLFVLLVYGIGFLFAVVGAWFALVFTARLPAGLYRYMTGVLTLCTQVGAYFMLATDRYPPFALGVTDHPVRAVWPAAPKDEYSRLKAAFRLILAIPWNIVSTAYGYVAMLAAVGSWFAIVFTGRQPEMLQKGLNMGIAAGLHYNAFASLTVEDWPPFEPELRLAPRRDEVGPGPEAPVISAA